VRLVLAIICFVIAAALVGLGVAQRTIFAEPAQVTVSTTVASPDAVVVLDSSALHAFQGSQTVTVASTDSTVTGTAAPTPSTSDSSNPSSSSPSAPSPSSSDASSTGTGAAASGKNGVFVAYGRTTDVVAWIGDTAYTKVSYDSSTGNLVSTHVPGKETTVPDPRGSDLWLDEYSRDSQVTTTIGVPDTVSFIIASDGTKPAPGSISLSWPLDNSTPWSTPLVIAGSLFLLGGLVLMLWALNYLRRGSGPRRRPPKMPRVPRRQLYRSSRRAVGRPASGRRRAFVAVPVVLAASVALSACATGGGASLNTPLPSASSSSIPAGSQPEPPDVTVRQVERIVSAISTVAAKADAARDAAAIATRFEGAALDLRLANYVIRGADPSVAALAAIPGLPVKLTLPQQTSTWPRTVFTVIQNDADTTVPPVALFLVQQDPRSNYKVVYSMTLEPSVTLPNVAPADIGAPRLSSDSGLLKTAPKEVAMEYGDILEKDTKAAAYLDFEVNGDSLRTAVGVTAKQALQASLPGTASVTFGHALGKADPIALATNDAGAIVAVNLNETTTVAPVEAGAAVNPTGQVKALSGVAISTKGVIATYGDQLLFFVPAAGTSAKIVLLGWSQGLVAASEIG
jgi:hypothetical protein